ncbi:TonB-dependent receptor [Pseudoalteromonas sp. MMG024]|uniref:TonB-dependent receptor n=1 Tax=Pseudoalteromonas sp. MMG024 TaxID=2909980 RepID=UPI0031BAEA0A|nr:TonB-dependent receptor [Pseudoalteromonas sp. MMG024]
MLAKNFKKSLLAVNIGLAMGAGFSGVAVAADSEVQAKEDVEVIEVRGIRRSLEASLNTKRFANGTVDAITAEDIGKMPDRNVAESLQRVPGVTVQRQWGEGAAVSIRGAGDELTLTTLNGQNVASTGWFVFEPAKRSFNYSLLPSELVGGVEVYKSSQADLVEGGVGGTVEINTRKPLDMDANSVYASLEALNSTDSEETTPLISGLYSWKNSSETFGLLVSGVYQERELQRQGNEAFWQWGAGPVAFKQERERSAIAATFQYAPTDALDMSLNLIDMEMAADNTNYALWLTQADTTWGGGETEEFLEGTPVKGPLNVGFWQSRPRQATMNSEVIDFTLNYAGDGYDFSVQFGDTSSTGGTDFEIEIFDAQGLNPESGTPIVDGSYDFTNGNQTWDLPNGIGGVALEDYVPSHLAIASCQTAEPHCTRMNRTPKTDEESYFQTDVKFYVDLGPITAIKTGLRYSTHNTTSRRFEFITADDFEPYIDTTTLTGEKTDIGAGDYQMTTFDSDIFINHAKAGIIGENEDLTSYSEIDEDNLAVYAMASFSTEMARGNFGLRIVNTDASSTYFLNGVKTSTDESYTEALPSFNIAFDITDDVILRANAARTMARPSYVNMYVNPNITGANDTLPDNQFWIVGNVGLKPFISNNLDLGIEWYFNESSLVSAGLFFKDVANFVTVNEYAADASDIDYQLAPDEVPNGWTVQELESNGTANIQGLELQYQQDFGNGFGSIVNYTYTDAETSSSEIFSDGNTEMSDSSKHVYNLTGYYENESFEVRMSYNWRSEYMIRDVGAYGNRLHDDFGTLDFSATWHATDFLDVRLTAVNLTEEGSVQKGNNADYSSYSGFTKGFPLFEYEMPRMVSLGVALRF